MTTNDKRRRLLLILAVSLVGLLVADRLIFTPVLSAWQSQQDRLMVLRAQVEQGGNLLEQETRWLRWQEEMRERMLPDNRAVAESQMLTMVDDWARAAGLKVTSMRPQWKERENQEPLLELQLTCTGGVATVVKFLYAVETARSAIAVEQVEIAAQGQDGRELGMNVKLSGLCLGPATQSRSRR